MEEAVAQGKDMIDRVKLIASTEQAQAAIDVSANVVNELKSAAITWGPLLQKIWTVQRSRRCGRGGKT